MKKETQVTKTQLLTPEARKNNLRLLAGFMAAATVGVVASIAVSTPTPTPTAGTDWRAKVGQATPAELAVQPPVAKPAAPVAETKPEVKPEADPVGDWAVRAYEAEQAHQDRCWDQLEERGYGDASCY